MEPVWTHISFKFAKSAKTNASYRQYFGFAKLKDTAAQEKAIAEYSGKEFQGRVIKVAAVTPEKPKKAAEAKEDSKSEPSKDSTKENVEAKAETETKA